VKQDPYEKDVERSTFGSVNALVAPRWLREFGAVSWLLVGITLLLAGVVLLLSLTYVIVGPLICAGVIAAVAGPAVSWLERRRIPRGVGATLALLALTGLGALVAILVIAGVASESEALGAHLTEAKNTLAGWLKGVGVDPGTAESVKKDLSASVTKAASTLVTGVGAGIAGLSSLAIFVALTVLSLFFLLKDGPTIGGFVERHLGVPIPLARTILKRISGSLRGYFVGVTVVALWSALIVGAGSLLLGVSLAGTIAVVTFLGGYIPYLGAWAAGVFAVLIALGDQGPETAMALAVIVLLANGIFQQLVQPVAYGAALGLNPLAVLIVTIAGGCLFGTVGLVLAAPLVSAAVKISADLAGARAEEEREARKAGQEPAKGPPEAPEPEAA
jgi:putative heme transporter